jgi:deazaflavin-dependent oxidoreductase (nitroreductase family)
MSQSTIRASGLMPALYRLVGGLGMGSLAVLSTMGARSRQQRDVLLSALEEGPVGSSSWLVVGSRGGDLRHPDWVYNLVAYPDQAWIQVGMRQMPVRAEILRDRERNAAWLTLVGEYPRYAEYAQMTDRVLPIVRLSAVELIKLPQVVALAAGA